MLIGNSVGEMIRHKQVTLLTNIIKAVPELWKILVCDGHGSDVISQLFTQLELRGLGVTLRLQLMSQRDPVLDHQVPAVYFCRPTEKNLDRIGQDLHDALYDSYYFHFTSPISEDGLRRLAAAAGDSRARVLKVCSHCCDFVALEDDLFVLNRWEGGGSKADDPVLDELADGLLGFFAMSGTVPIIRTPRGGDAQSVAGKLDEKLRICLKMADPRFRRDFTFDRPLLVILDRSVDMVTPLRHPLTYQALIDDVFGLRLNRLTIPDAGTWHLTVRDDDIWQTHRGNEFAHVFASIPEILDDYKAWRDKLASLNKKLAPGGADSGDAAQELASLRVWQVKERGQLLYSHATIATHLSGEINLRKLNVFFRVEDELLTGSSPERSVADIISDPECGTAQDKLRLFLIYFLSSTDLSESQVDQFMDLLEASGCDLDAVRYLKLWKASVGQDCQDSDQSILAKLLSQGSTLIMEGVKNLVGVRRESTVVRILDDLMDLKCSPETDDFEYFDPTFAGAQEAARRRNSAPYRNAVVFMVDGGCYEEYHDLARYAKLQADDGVAKSVVYGCPALNNPAQFIAELSALGRKL